jgi:sugar fermentation stimulation protein A
VPRSRPARLAPPAAHPARRTGFDVVLARAGDAWVSLLPTLAERLFEDALARGTASGLRGARVIRREAVHGRSRFDFQLRHRGRAVLAEVKSVGLVENGQALFPDAPTERGARHLRELAAHALSGGSALLAFVVQRADAHVVAPHLTRDPEFARALKHAREAGVRLLGYSARVDTRGAVIVGRLPVVLPR